MKKTLVLILFILIHCFSGECSNFGLFEVDDWGSTELFLNSSEIDQSSNNFDKLQEELKWYKNRNRYHVSVIWIIIGLVVIIASFLAYHFHMIKKRRDMERRMLLEDAKRMQTSISHKNELINELNQSSDPGLKNATEGLISKIQIENDWVAFQATFDKIYPKFNQGLKRKHSNLNSNDLRFCSLIRLSLSNKEIAEVLNLSLEGVKSAKQRIRKKMKIESYSRLSDYLLDPDNF